MAFKVKSKIVAMGGIDASPVTGGGLPGVVLNNATTALATANLNAKNGGLVIRTVSGTPALGFRLNGTVYYVLNGGTVGT